MDVEGYGNLKIVDSPYRHYNCQEGNPLGCTLPRSSTSDGPVLNCSICFFPSPLADNAEIRGRDGIYRINEWIGKRGLGRLYRATLLGLNQPVAIKEYLLPQRHFSLEETRQRQQSFAQLAGIDLADGRLQDFRLLTMMEAIADIAQARCYLVLDPTSASPTLREYLLGGVCSENLVYRLLQQVLQSLKFLHEQNFRLSSGQMVAGLVHGNLSLDSLLISFKTMERESSPIAQPSDLSRDGDFYIYLCDLSLWEGLFLPSVVQSSLGSVADDLVALGSVAHSLLAADIAKENPQPLDPSKSQHWPPVEPRLKQFILRLLRVEQPFESADVALQELYRFPPPPQKVPTMQVELPPEPAPKKRIGLRLLVLAGSLLGLVLLGWLVGLLISNFNAKSSPAKTLLLCCFKDVAGISPGTFTYAAPQNGTWSYVLQQKNLIRQGVTLDRQLKSTFPQLNLKLEPTTSIERAIANVRSGNAAFAIAPLLQPLPDDLESQTIAYDGIAVFVAFSYSKREQSLPMLLDGRLTLEQIARVYSSQRESWQAFDGPALRLQRYSPQNNEVLEVFRTRIVDRGFAPNPLPEFEMMRAVIRDFELRDIGSIGFATFSKAVGQCSVYPLALGKKGQPPVQVLKFKNGKPISPATDLCSKKGTYALNPRAFQTGRYPLAYPLAVIYPRDNDRPSIGEKIAEALKTSEGQRLLAETGLVPLP
ncbi:hypothetical protein [Altericista sp. CCNU0014]|uniref:hypothetical protein n=1 Tax=Altericista sp. CCNU0014 TaxID=3082949 RepID=UPI00384BE669